MKLKPDFISLLKVFHRMHRFAKAKVGLTDRLVQRSPDFGLV